MPSHHLDLQAGQFVFREGDAVDNAYIIERGKIQIFTGDDDNRLVICELGPGDILGEMAVIDDMSRTASALVISNCRLNVISREQFIQRIENADPIIRLLLSVLIKRYRSGLKRFLEPGDDSLESLIDLTDEEALSHGIEKIRLENELRAALVTEQLQVRYQPVIELATGKVAGFEALVRWPHQDMGMIPPDHFIALAEETDLIVPVGLYVARKAALAMRKFQDRAPERELFMSVNISGRQVHVPDLCHQFAQAVLHQGLKTQQFKLEITESLLLDYEHVKSWIEKSRQRGFRIALDDFGTGYSGLGHLGELSIDTLKIDKTFINAMFESRRSMAILESMISLAKGLELEIIAEGVETREQLDLLREKKVDLVQGYLIDKPLNDEAAAEAVTRSASVA